jgi:hypothetical protein
VTPTDAIRWTWTMLTAWGVLFALWNLREVLIDHWAISQVQHRPVAVLKLQTRGEVWNHALILVALASDCIAGVFALAGVSIGALVALIVSAIALIVLSFTQTQRRRHIFNAIRLRRPQSDGLEQTK